MRFAEILSRHDCVALAFEVRYARERQSCWYCTVHPDIIINIGLLYKVLNYKYQWYIVVLHIGQLNIVLGHALVTGHPRYSGPGSPLVEQFPVCRRYRIVWQYKMSNEYIPKQHDCVVEL